MSLQVWLPLTGHLNNQGLSNVSITNNGATVDNNGKLGKCYSFDGSSNKITISNLPNPKNISVAFWMKRNATTNTRQFMFTAWNGISLEMTQDNKIRGYVYNGAQCYSTNTITVDSGWVHVVYTFKDKTEGKLYINGVLDSTVSYSNSIQWNTTIGNIGNYNDMYYNGKINDFRIYDHALSAKEVKELSKGLVLHYPLSAGFGGAENLFRDSAMGQHAIDNFVSNGSEDWTKYFRYYNGTTANHSFSDGIDTITLQSGANIGIAFQRKATDIALDSSSYYTISCEAKCEVSGAHLDIGLSYYNTSNAWVWRGGSNPKNFTAVDTWQKFTHTFKPDANTQYIMYCFTINSTTGKHFSIRHCKLEKGEVATPWTMNMLDTEMADLAMTEYDVSGYNYHGTKTNITYSSDTARYNVSSSFNGTDSNIVIPYNEACPLNIFTVNLWFKKDALGSNSYETLFGGPSGFEMDTRAASATTLSYYMASARGGNVYSPLEFGKWTMLTMVRDGTNEMYYVDGDLKKTIAAVSMPTGTYYIGAWQTATKQNYYGLISDFRIYATALSADDIKELYNTAASLANNGTLFAYDFVEA